MHSNKEFLCLEQRTYLFMGICVKEPIAQYQDVTLQMTLEIKLKGQI